MQPLVPHNNWAAGEERECNAVIVAQNELIIEGNYETIIISDFAYASFD